MKRILLLLLCVPLFWVGGVQVLRLVKSVFQRSVLTPFPESLEKELKDVQAAAMTTAAHAEIRSLILTTSEKPAVAERDLSPADKKLLAGLRPYAETLASTRVALKLVAQDSRDAKRYPKDFLEWLAEWVRVDASAAKVRGFCTDLSGEYEKSTGVQGAPAGFDARARGLLSDQEAARTKYFDRERHATELVLKECMWIIEASQTTKRGADSFKRLSGLITANGQGAYAAVARDLAKAVAHRWADQMLPSKLNLDSKVLLRDYHGKYALEDSKKIIYYPEGLREGLERKPERQFEDEPVEVTDLKKFLAKNTDLESGYIGRVLPTEKTLVAHAYNQARAAKKKLSATILEFEQTFEEVYDRIIRRNADVLKARKNHQGKEMSFALEQLRAQNAEAWNTLQELKRIVTECRALFE